MFRISALGKGLIVTVVSVLVAGVSVFALVVGFHAVNCLNDNLGDRNGITSQASAAQIRDAEAFRALLHALALPGATDKQKFAAYTAYVQEQNDYVRVLNHVNAYREAHPLGHC